MVVFVLLGGLLGWEEGMVENGGLLLYGKNADGLPEIFGADVGKFLKPTKNGEDGQEHLQIRQVNLV